MSHKSVRLLIEDVAKSLGDNIQFTYARTSDFNAEQDKKYPYIVLDPLTAGAEFAVDGVYNYSKTWNCNMAFYGLDNMGSDQDHYKLILDEMGDYVDNFVNKLNKYAYDSDKILIASINQTAFIKTTKDVLTGFLLTFSLSVQDDFDYCAIDCEIPNTHEC